MSLVLNRSKSREIFNIHRQETKAQLSASITVIYTITRVSAIKILGVDVSSNLSVCGHVNNVIACK